MLSTEQRACYECAAGLPRIQPVAREAMLMLMGSGEEAGMH